VNNVIIKFHGLYEDLLRKKFGHRKLRIEHEWNDFYEVLPTDGIWTKVWSEIEE